MRSVFLPSTFMIEEVNMNLFSKKQVRTSKACRNKRDS
jgi:hypothetical protein